MPPGQPKKWDREKIFHDLLEWSKQDDSINLCAFCDIMDLPPSMLVQFSKEEPEYVKAYELTKSRLGARRERKLSDTTLHVKAYDLNATNYDYFLREERKLQQEMEAKIKSQTEVSSAMSLCQLVKSLESNAIEQK